MKTTPRIISAEDHVFGEGLDRAMERMAQEGRAVTNLALFLTAPLAGLIYIVVFPFVGFTALAWAAVKR